MYRHYTLVRMRRRPQSSSADVLFQHIQHYISVYALAVVLIIVGILTTQTHIITQTRVTVMDTLSPLIRGVSTQKQRLNTMTDDITSLAELKAENERLETDIVKLKQWYQTAIALQAENRTLRAFLNLKIPKNQSFVTARVLADTSSRFVKTLLVDAGTADGLQKNHAVMTPDGMLGRVIDPVASLSRILLLTDINSRVPVMIAETNQHAIMIGNNTDTPILDYLSEDTFIDDNAVLLTSGRAGVFPFGLPIGTVTRDKEGTYSVSLYAKPARLLYVTILNAPLRKLTLTEPDQDTP